MLVELTIQDIVLIDRLTLQFGDGLSALTGETGAGKSILLDSLGLATGGKADKGLVRQGADRGSVHAVFDVPESHGAWALLNDAGVAAEDDLILLRRVQNADGKSRAFINDQTVPVSVLRRVGQSLIEVHGQHESQGFLDHSVHGHRLDAFAGLAHQVEAVGNAWQDLKAVRRQISELETQQEMAGREADYLRHAAEELQQLAPEPGEERALAEQRAVLMAAEKVAEDIGSAVAVLSEDGLEAKVSSAAGRMERASERLTEETAAPLLQAAQRLDAVLSEFAEARGVLLQAAEAFVQDEEALEETEQRLFALRAAGRKYGCAPDQLHQHTQDIRRQLETLDAGEASFTALRAREAELDRAYQVLATALSARRQKAATSMAKAVMRELKPLKLDKARFRVTVETHPDHQGPEGIDRVSFEVSTNPGAPFGPLRQIVSGGELSRFVLALKSVLTAKDGRSVIVFDEVDSGVGGAVADAIGERLARIASNAQTLVVTHSPQVAARAVRHFRVQKSGKRTVKTHVSLLSKADRQEEIARMLSGREITDEARAAAAKLLADGAWETAA